MLQFCASRHSNAPLDRSRSGCRGHGWTERWPVPIANDTERKSRSLMNARCYVPKYLAILIAINGRDVEMGFVRWNEVRLMRRILLGVIVAPFAVALIAVAALIVNDQLDK